MHQRRAAGEYVPGLRVFRGYKKSAAFSKRCVAEGEVAWQKLDGTSKMLVYLGLYDVTDFGKKKNREGASGMRPTRPPPGLALFQVYPFINPCCGYR